MTILDLIEVARSHAENHVSSEKLATLSAELIELRVLVDIMKGLHVEYNQSTLNEVIDEISSSLDTSQISNREFVEEEIRRVRSVRDSVGAKVALQIEYLKGLGRAESIITKKKAGSSLGAMVTQLGAIRNSKQSEAAEIEPRRKEISCVCDDICRARKALSNDIREICGKDVSDDTIVKLATKGSLKIAELNELELVEIKRSKLARMVSLRLDDSGS